MRDYKFIKSVLDKYIKQYGDDLYKEMLAINNSKSSNTTEVIVDNNIETNYLIDTNVEIKKIIWNDTSINLYMDLFFNRTDVYAKFISYISKDGEQIKLYTFSCENEWKEGCYKKVGKKCTDCPLKKFQPINSSILKTHLEGKNIFGSYISNSESKTKVLIFDFDKVNDLEMINQIYNICNVNDINAYLEISQSKKGFHLWIFFDDYISNYEARRFGFLLLSMSMQVSRIMNFEYFDRIFPTQDYINNTKDGLGNLIRLPLSATDVANNGCVFLDKSFKIVENQIEFLNNIKKNSIKWISNFVNKNSTKALDINLKNAHAVNFLENIKCDKLINIEVSNELAFNFNELNNQLFQWLAYKTSFVNPEYIKNQRMRVSVYKVPYIISSFRLEHDILYIPKGFLNTITDAFKKANIEYKIINKINKPKKLEFIPKYELYDYQKIGLLNLIKKDTGILEGKTGSGKTIIGIELINRLKVHTVIFVHNTVLAKQWYDRLLEFTDLTKDDIDLNKNKKAKIMIRTLQSMNDESKFECLKDVGLMIVDECHHSAAYSFEKVIRKVNCKYVYGLTATLSRSDRLEKIANGLFGDVVTIEANNNATDNKKLKIIPTTFSIAHNKDMDLNSLYSELIKDEKRNNEIINVLLTLYNQKNRNILVLSEWLTHIANIKKIILEKDKNVNLIVLHGQLNNKELKIEFEKANLNQRKIILATGKFLGEGYDLQNLDTIVNIFPFSFEGKLKQYVGRIRDAKDKKILAIDFHDKYIFKFNTMFAKRYKEYKKIGFVNIEEEKKTNQYIFTLDNFVDNFKIDYDNCKEVIGYRYSSNNFFKNANLIDKDNKKIKYLKQSENYSLNWIIFDKRVCWQLVDEYVIRFDDNNLYKELLNSYKSS